MSMSSSLSNALSGLNVTSRRAEVVSNNIANALTEGYGRRQLETGSFSGGVRSLGVTRFVDAGIIADRRLAEAQLFSDQKSSQMLSKIEAVIGSPTDADSIGARLTAFESQLVFAASDPSSTQRLTQLNTSLNAVADKLQESTKQIQTLRQESDRSIANDVNTLNRNLKLVEQLNADIQRSKLAGQDASSLFDARQQVVDEISGIVPIRELNRDSDQLALMSKSGMMLIDGKASQFEFSETPTIVADMTLDSGGLSGITKDGVSLQSNGFGKLKGGSLEAAFTMRDQALVQAQAGLDQIALDLASRFEDPAVDPTVATTGLLTDGGNPVDPSDYIGLASRISLNASVDPNQGGNVAQWRDGVGAVSLGPAGNGAQLTRYLDAMQAAGGVSGKSAAQNVAELSADFGQQRLNAEKELSFSAARWDSLHNAELATGVDTDAELQNLLLVEQAYAANAKVIQTVGAMLQQIMEI
jgi:flagellar hook-associated protein 1 FlgK